MQINKFKATLSANIPHIACVFRELKKNYQELLLKHHPDKNGGQESETFIAVNEAWRVLGNQELRAVYDAEQSNSQLERSQDTAIWNTFSLNDLVSDDGMLGMMCSVEGKYQVEEEVVRELKLEGEEEVLVDCDTCSLNIILLLSS